MKEKRIFFFYPPKKVESASQTIFNVIPSHKKGIINNNLAQNTLDSLLLRNTTFQNNFQKSLIQHYSSHLGFYCSLYNDNRFDLLTPPKDLFTDFPISLSFDFFENHFVITNPLTSQFLSFVYSNSIFPILNSIEDGVISTELFVLIEQLHCNSYLSGILLCKISDFRFSKPIIFKSTLKINSTTLSYKLSLKANITQNEKLEIEKKNLMI